jgi:hypothetical protein
MSTLKQTSTKNQAATLLEACMTAFMIPGTWGRGTEARRSDGVEVEYQNPKACTFCAVGALSAAKKDLGASQEAYQLAVKTLDDQAKKHRLGNFHDGIVSFNDARGRKEPVIEVFAVSADSLR